MGYTSTGGPEGMGVFNDTPTTVADHNQHVTDLVLRGNVRKGTSSARTALTGASLYNGLLWSETDTGMLWRYDGTAWVNTFTPGVDWTTTGLTITPGTGFSIVAYRLRKRGTRVQGFVRVSNDTAGTITVGSNADISPDVPLFTMPSGWRNGMGYDIQQDCARTGISMWQAVAVASTGVVNLIGGIPTIALLASHQLTVYIDYTTD